MSRKLAVPSERFVIEHDVPLQRHIQRSPLTPIAARMKPGDSVVVDNKSTAQTFRQAICRQPDMFGVIRQIDETTWRVWCLTKADAVGLPRVGGTRRRKSR